MGAKECPLSVRLAARARIQGWPLAPPRSRTGTTGVHDLAWRDPGEIRYCRSTTRRQPGDRRGSVTGSAMPTDPSDELSRPHPSHLRRDTMRRKDDVMSADTRLDELSVSGLGGSGLGGEIRCSVDTREYLGVSCIHQRWTNQPCRSGSTTCDVPETGPDLRHPICPRRSCVNALTRTPELPRTAAPQKPQQ